MAYLEFCEKVAPYLVATLGILAIGTLIAVLMLLISQLWYMALCEWTRRFQATWKNTVHYKEFREFRAKRKECKQ